MHPQPPRSCLFRTNLLFLGVIVCTISCAPPDETTLFARNCAVCHTFQGSGGRMGPDLTAVANRLNSEQIIAILNDPQAVRPDARMPSFRHFSNEKKRSLADFLSK